MNKNQLIIGAIGLAIIIVAIFFWSSQRAIQVTPPTGIIATTSDSVATTVDETAATGTIKSIISSIFKPTPPTEFNPRDPWQVLDKYLAAAKAHDIAGVKSLSYQQSATCADPKRQEECFALMDGVYAFKSRLSADDFPIKWEDNKQLVLQTAVIADNTADTRGYRQGIIIFTKKSAGDLQVLYFNPNRGWYVTATSTSSLTPDEKLRGMMADEDQDGLEDQVESCINQPNPASCVKTDPDRRDTNGNGWWDGVEAYFYK